MEQIKQYVLNHYYIHYKNKVDPIAETYIKEENWLFPSLADLLSFNDNYQKVVINRIYSMDIDKWLRTNIGNDNWMRFEQTYFFETKKDALFFKTWWI